MKGMWQQGKKRIKKFRTGIKIQYSIKGYHKFQHHNLIFHQANLGKPLETVKAPNTIYFFFTTGKFSRHPNFWLQQVIGVRK